MKKISALLAIVMLLSAFVFAFSSCAPGVNVNTVNDDPVKFLSEAMNKANAEFFKDESGITELASQMAQKGGSVKIAADLAALLGSAAKFDMTIYNEASSKNSALDINFDIGGTKLGGQLYAKPNASFIIKSESLLGTAQAYLFDPSTFAQGLNNSAFADLTENPEDLEEAKKAIEEYCKMAEYMMGQTAEKANALTKKLYEALDYEADDAGENVALVMKLNNQTIKDFFNTYFDEDIFTAEEKAALKEQMDEAINQLSEQATIELELVYMIRKDNGALDSMIIRGTVEANEMTVDVNAGYTVTADKMTIFANASTGEDSAEEKLFDLKIETVKEKTGDNVKYTTTASVSVGNATINLGTLTFNYNVKDGKYKIVLSIAKELMEAPENFNISVSGVAKRDGGKATITLSEIDAPALEQKLNLDVSVVLDKDAKLPEFPKDAKDIINISKTELEAIVMSVANLFSKGQ